MPVTRSAGAGGPVASLPRSVRALAVIHPFPSLVNTLLVVALALLAGAPGLVALQLGGAMLGLQACIGAVNDLFDEDLDALAKPGKPIPAGLIGRTGAAAVALVGAGAAVVLSAPFGALVLALALGMLGAGLAYDALLKRTAFGWVAYAVAFPMLPVYAWLGAGAGLPPRSELLLPVAALAGPTLALANGLADIERDVATGVRGPAVVLGRRRAIVVLVGLHIAVFAVALGSLLVGPAVPVAALAMVVVAGLLALGGIAGSASASAARRERGWEAQAVAVALLGAGWLLAVLR